MSRLCIFRVLTAWVIVALAHVSWATSVRPPRFAELVAAADCVVRTETVSARCEWRGEGEARHIVTLVTVHVLRCVVGAAPETMELEFLGGTVDGQTMEVADQPQFHAADRDILFVQGNRRQFCPLAAMRYGRYPIVRDPLDASRELVARENGAPLRAVAEVSRPIPEDAARATAAAGSPEPLSVAEFEAEIRRSAVALGRKDVVP